MALVIVSSPRFADHVTPVGHPERVARAAVFDEVARRWSGRGARVVEPAPAGHDDLRRVHDARYLEALAGVAGRSVTLDPDTVTSPHSHHVALLAAGAACLAADLAVAGNHPTAAFVRPPGHHAERDRAMGFCLFNNVAVAAARARQSGVARVAIVDIDVHHGNGTQWAYYEDPAVLYVSLHQYPYYPGTGGVAEIGRGAGSGTTVNIPLEAGATDADYDLALASVVVPVLEAFGPELLIVSAGYDAHHRDPLAGMRVSTEGFGAVMARLWSLAVETCAGRLVVVTEGGYDLPALGDGLEVTLETIATAPRPVTPVQGDTSRAREALAALRAVQAPYWPTL